MRQKLLLLIFSLKVLLIKCNWRSIMVKMTFEEYQNESYILVFWHCTYSNIILTYIIIHFTTWTALVMNDSCLDPFKNISRRLRENFENIFDMFESFLFHDELVTVVFSVPGEFLSVQTRLGMAWKCLLLFPFKTPKVEAQFNQIIN